MEKIDTPGSAMFWYMPEKNPLAFEDFVDMNWMSFELSGHPAEFYSEGKKLFVALNRGTEKEKIVLAAKMKFREGIKHCISLTWHATEIALLLNGSLIKTVSPLSL